MGAGHHHGVVRPTGREARRRQRHALRVALLLNATFAVVELVGGLAFGSLALLADAAHMASDVAGLAVALVAVHLAGRASSARHSYGWQRAEVLGAQANGVILVATAGWVLVEAFRRLGDPVDVHGAGMIAVALAGLAVNGLSLLVLARAGGSSLNMHGAVVHMGADAVASIGAVVAAAVVITTGAEWADPAVSALIGLLVLRSAWRLLRDATHVLMEGAPATVDPVAVEAALAALPGVAGSHHVHVWSLASDVPALSAHLVIDGRPDLHEVQARTDEARHMLAERFGVRHATLEAECHPCDAEPHPDH